MRILEFIAHITAFEGFLSSLPSTTVAGENIGTSTPILAVETRCGWFHNPTPPNTRLIDRHGDRTIGVRCGYQAEGDGTEFRDN